MSDILIQNGKILDGKGSDAFESDMYINDGMIKAIGKKLNYKVEKVIDAKGKCVAPGFIDVVNHSDVHLTLFSMQGQDSMVRQGITTILGGNCGSSLAPLVSKEAIRSIQKWGKIEEINVDWIWMGEFLQAMKRLQLGVNFGSLVGYSTVRRGVIGDEVRPLTDMEQNTILSIVARSLEEGAFGVSLGLVFSHMRLVSFEELRKLAEVVKKHNKILVVHMRDDGEKVLEALNEVIKVVQGTGVRIEIAHLKVMGRKNWSKFEELYQKLRESIDKDNLPIGFSVFPYDANNSVSYILLPDWVTQGGKKYMLERLLDADMRHKAIEDMRANSLDYDRIINTFSPHNRHFGGKTIVEIAQNQGVSVEEALINLVVASGGAGTIVNHSIKNEHLQRLLEDKHSIIITDGMGYDDNFTHSGNFIHPRSYGAMPRFLEMVTKKHLKLSLEEAIYKITGLPAERYGLRDRGVLKVGNIADVVIFDEHNIKSDADYVHPLAYPQGIECVIMKGKTVLEANNLDNSGVGEILYS
jgi:N-acyl-D-amino-acid deacylase